MPSVPGSATLLRSIGLLPDGPVRWGQPLTTRRPGLYVVELPDPRPAPPVELTRVGKWIEKVETLRLDGERPSSRALLARLAELWLPDATTIYAGATGGSLGARVHALVGQDVGARRPHPDGHWLGLLTNLDRCRIWTAETDAPEEYLDAFLDAFAADGMGAVPDARPAGALPLPWATLRRPTGERQATGLSGSYLPDDREPPVTIRSIVDVADGDAEGARTPERGTGSVRRAPHAPPAPPTASRQRAPTLPRTAPASGRGRATSRPVEPIPMTASALASLDSELDELTRVRRPEVVARIKAARELGDLRENAEYQAAREEQSFLEGRVQLLEERKRAAVVVEEAVGDRAGMGSTLVVEHEGERQTLMLVGSTESDPAAGRISVASPVGAALVGARPGADVDVRTPRGAVRYRVIEVR